MNSVTLILLYGVLLIFVNQLTIASQQVDEGNYIVPRTTLELSTNTNRSAEGHIPEGHKKICNSNLDCEQYTTNNQCCLTVSGFSKCRKKCSTRNRRRHWGKKRRKNPNKQRKIKSKKRNQSKSLDCPYRNTIHKDGSFFQAKDGCNQCYCDKGKLSCTERRCPPGKCTFQNKPFDEGYLLMLHNGCKRCVCRHSLWNCTSHPCNDDQAQNSKADQRNSAISYVPSIVLVVLCSTIHSILPK